MRATRFMAFVMLTLCALAAGKAAHRSAPVHGHGTGSLSELPPDCLAWDHLWRGDAPLTAARANPDEWIPVFVMTAGELAITALGIRLPVLDATPYAVRYDSASGKFLAYPLHRMPRNANLPVSPEALRDVWGPLVQWAGAPLLRASGAIDRGITVAVDIVWRFVAALRDVFRTLGRVA